MHATGSVWKESKANLQAPYVIPEPVICASLAGQPVSLTYRQNSKPVLFRVSHRLQRIAGIYRPNKRSFVQHLDHIADHGGVHQRCHSRHKALSKGIPCSENMGVFSGSLPQESYESVGHRFRMSGGLLQALQATRGREGRWIECELSI